MYHAIHLDVDDLVDIADSGQDAGVLEELIYLTFERLQDYYEWTDIQAVIAKVVADLNQSGVEFL